MCHKIYQNCHFGSFSIFCLACKTISRRAARRLIVLHPKQNIESEPKRQSCSILWRIKMRSSVKGLTDEYFDASQWSDVHVSGTCKRTKNVPKISSNLTYKITESL